MKVFDTFAYTNLHGFQTMHLSTIYQDPGKALDALCMLATLLIYLKDLNTNNVINLRCYKSQHIRESKGLFWRQKFKGRYQFNPFQNYTRTFKKAWQRLMKKGNT